MGQSLKSVKKRTGEEKGLRFNQLDEHPVDLKFRSNRDK